MFYIVETPAQLVKLSVFSEEESFVQVIPVSEQIHLRINNPCLVYYRPLSAKHGFILAIDHTETLSLRSNTVIGFLNSLEGQIWTIDKKSTLYWDINESSLKGLKMAYTLSDQHDFPEIPKFNTPAHQFYDRHLKKRNDINRFIPVSKHYEKWEGIFDKLNFTLRPEGFDFYNELVTNSFFRIECEGLATNDSEFDKHYPNFKKRNSIYSSLIFSYYNLYNATARPSCNFNSLNFMAMDKGNGCRKAIVPLFDYFVEFDYKSYQVKLLADLIEYKFAGNIHEELAKLYFKTDTITPEQYETAKKMTFRYSYGREDEPPDIEFFKQVYELRDKLWEYANIHGYIMSPISGRRLYGISKKTQILPYLMQCVETERNAIILDSLYRLLSRFDTRLVLYCYDSFLFDVKAIEGHGLLEEIKEILEGGGYKTSMVFGYNYDEMTLATIP